MKVEEAKQLKYGQRVACPEDRGDPAFIGTVRTEGLDTTSIYTNRIGEEYIWVEVSRPGRAKSVWPSNRLGVA